MHFMDNEVIKLAKRKSFRGILATNTSPLTQQLDSDVFGYKTLHEYQINQYVYHDGSKPFEKAANTVKVKVQWKDIQN